MSWVDRVFPVFRSVTAPIPIIIGGCFPGSKPVVVLPLPQPTTASYPRCILMPDWFPAWPSAAGWPALPTPSILPTTPGQTTNTSLPQVELIPDREAPTKLIISKSTTLQRLEREAETDGGVLEAKALLQICGPGTPAAAELGILSKVQYDKIAASMDAPLDDATLNTLIKGVGTFDNIKPEVLAAWFPKGISFNTFHKRFVAMANSYYNKLFNTDHAEMLPTIFVLKRIGAVADSEVSVSENQNLPDELNGSITLTTEGITSPQTRLMWKMNDLGYDSKGYDTDRGGMLFKQRSTGRIFLAKEHEIKTEGWSKTKFTFREVPA